MTSRTHSPGGTRPVVYVVESDEVMRSALSFILRDAYDIHAYACLEQARTAVGRAPEVVLLEPRLMPLADTDVAGARIVLTAETGGPAPGAGRLPKTAGVLGRPITADDVRGKVAAAIGEARARPRLSIVPGEATRP
ncbi:MAG: hypothetical protein P4M07_17110 [Xanthobacteraceae bacterium]|nr:hypothetical protein [Xanthobacteraceae bacterium]